MDQSSFCPNFDEYTFRVCLILLKMSAVGSWITWIIQEDLMPTCLNDFPQVSQIHRLW